ncbi:MAG TPA: hypothetical protein PLR25_17650, partial [Planctomycetaceae bacterium]|nr:hypothetical protein [Planctomycetaceae bacterium]
MSVTSREFIIALRKFVTDTGRTRRFRRMTQRHRGHVSAPVEALEQRQLLVEPLPQPVLSVTTTSNPITVNWTQPSSDPAQSFDLTVSRTDLVSGGVQAILVETALPAKVAAGVAESYSITEPWPAGGYSVSVISRDASGNVSPAAIFAFTLSPPVPQMLHVSGQKFNGTNFTVLRTIPGLR